MHEEQTEGHKVLQHDLSYGLDSDPHFRIRGNRNITFTFYIIDLPRIYLDTFSVCCGSVYLVWGVGCCSLLAGPGRHLPPCPEGAGPMLLPEYLIADPK